MRYYTCDTSTIVSRKLTDFPDTFLFSGVVLLELMASATDESERRRYEALALDYEKDDSLIVPDLGDWVLASKVLYWLTQGRRRASQGRAPKLFARRLPENGSRRLDSYQRDALERDDYH